MTPRSGAGRGRAKQGRPYHHGNLRAVLLQAALEHITRWGPATLSLRELARQAGVSHAAPARHFRDKTGVFTAIAIDGFRQFVEAARTTEAPLALPAAGLAYLRFAIEHPAHFTVMNRPDLYDPSDPDLIEAIAASDAEFYGGVSQLAGDEESSRAVALAARCAMHGLISLWLNGALSDYGTDVEATAVVMGQGLMALGMAAQRELAIHPELADPESWGGSR